MRRFVEEADRGQRTLLPECLDDFIIFLGGLDRHSRMSGDLLVGRR
jgi:hypothetical protein